MDTIKIGDVVNVYFNTSDAIFDAKILYTPASTGDCFILIDKSGKIYNVQQYNYMVKD